MKKNRAKIFGLLGLAALGGMALSACGGGSTGGDGGNSSGGIGPDDTTTSAIEDDTGDIDNDVEVIDGEVVYAGEQITLWTIVGDPDLSGQVELINQFNQDHRGEIAITYRNIGHYDFYNTLEDTWANDRQNFPDLIIMHNEKTAQYAYQGMLRQIDSILDNDAWSGYFDYDLSQVYENIDRSQHYGGHRYGIPIDAHGWVTHFRQDIIKKNGLGFDDNTRYVPETRDEYQSLLEALREKADDGELLIRNITAGENHSWYYADPDTFYPEFTQSTDPDGLGAIYANGGSLATADGLTITFHENEGFQTYLTDIVERYNAKLMGEAGTNTEVFSQGRTVIFPEGPWWTSQSYDSNMNNAELRTANSSLGVSEEDAADPVYAYPMLVSNSAGFWTISDNVGTEAGSKWYGNGHAFSISSQVTSLTKIYACLEFARWYTHGTHEESDGSEALNLVSWCEWGHIPAYKDIYESEEYQAMAENNVTVRGLGDPSDVISMEPLPYEATIFDCVANCVSNVTTGLRGGSITTAAQALQAMNDTVAAAQAILDLMSLF